MLLSGLVLTVFNNKKHENQLFVNDYCFYYVFNIFFIFVMPIINHKFLIQLVLSSMRNFMSVGCTFYYNFRYYISMLHILINVYNNINCLLILHVCLFLDRYSITVNSTCSFKICILT